MKHTLKRITALALVFCFTVSGSLAEEKPKSIFGSIGDWISQAAEDTENWVNQATEDAGDWVSQAAEDAGSWINQAAEDTGNWIGQAAQDTSAWASQAWNDASGWTMQAWNDSTKWVEQAWKDSGEWISINWDSFIVWINTIISGNPYSWIVDMIGEDGLLAYNSFVILRSFYSENPDEKALQEYFHSAMDELSITKEDSETIWSTIQMWAEVKGLPMDQTVKLLLPFVTRLQIRGDSAIGDDASFSGPVVTKYLLTALESLKLDSSDDASMKLKIMNSALDGLTRPVIIGEEEQNTMVTDDGYYIENFTYEDNKYQIIMIATAKKGDSEYPAIHGSTLPEIAGKYFTMDKQDPKEEMVGTHKAMVLPLNTQVGEEQVTGKALAIWTEKYEYVIFFLTNQEWNEDEYSSWLASLSTAESNAISFNVDVESDGAFAGINQGAQKYTITRLFNEEKFKVPLTGHGWAAERGNNLIDNIKGIFRGQHSTVVGDNNVLNGPDRITKFAGDPNRILRIQTKYYSDASRSIAACFDDGIFKYMDAEGKPMQIEVPADQYEKAVRYMEARIKNNEVPNVSDPAEAKNIVRKGSLTYQQAKHIAKAGTVESIGYDSLHACVSAASSMGLSAALDFAICLWNGEPFEIAIRDSVYKGLQVGGTSFVVSVLSAQLMKTGINSTLVPVTESLSKALGNKAAHYLVKAFTGKSIYGAAATKSAARLLRSNTVTSVVTFVVMSSADVADIIQGRISWKQLAKNMSTTAAEIGGGTAGYLLGAAVGSAILPGAGTVVGLIIGAAAGWGASVGADALADLIAEDDADEMIRIIETQFPEIAMEYFLSEEEVNKAVQNLQNLITPNTLKEMYQYSDSNLFARQLIEMAMDPVIAEREHVNLPSDEEYSTYMESVIEELYEAEEKEEKEGA